jgi:hypothetical protein
VKLSRRAIDHARRILVKVEAEIGLHIVKVFNSPQIDSKQSQKNATMSLKINILILKFIWNYKGPRKSQNNFEKEQSWRTNKTSVQDLILSYRNKDSVVLAEIIK